MFDFINKKQNDWKEFGLKGKVKSFKEYSYEAIEISGKIRKGERTFPNDILDTSAVFDENGNIAKYFEYDIYDEIETEFFYEYDNDGKLIKMSESNETLWIFKYDKKKK